MNVSDFIPHGLIAALAGTVAYVFKEHTKLDDDRYAALNQTLSSMSARQLDISDTMAANHAELLRVMLESERSKSHDATRP